MEARRARQGASRIRLAALTALGSAMGCFLIIALGSQGADAGAPGPNPDLVTLGISRSDLVLDKRGKHRFLRLSNTVGNRGGGPLDIAPGEPGETGPCDDDEYTALQGFFDDTNSDGHLEGVELDQPADRYVPFGCMRFHDAPGHMHWHVLSFAKYELRRAKTGKKVSSNKVGFCVIDTEQPFPTLPGSPEKPFYPQGKGCGSTDEPPELEGLSIGWADIYFFGLPGQSLDISKSRRGRYCLISTADPNNLITESNEFNNAETVRLKLRPRKLKLKKLDGSCR
ncbi:MAG TPA: lysyl oxidase family protein [Solirubrobacterales bacterium]|jgi:Lysyl oxidase|nr:lysyl oxidase family protein [Solirubrobacterales bacterium]